MNESKSIILQSQTYILNMFSGGQVIIVRPSFFRLRQPHSLSATAPLAEFAREGW